MPVRTARGRGVDGEPGPRDGGGRHGRGGGGDGARGCGGRGDGRRHRLTRNGDGGRAAVAARHGREELQVLHGVRSPAEYKIDKLNCLYVPIILIVQASSGETNLCVVVAAPVGGDGVDDDDVVADS